MGKKSKKKVYSKVKKRCISFIMALIMIITIVPSMPVKQIGTVEAKSAGQLRSAVVEVAKNQLWYRAEAGKNNKYGAYFGGNYQDWCAFFVAWCMKTAGVPTSVYNSTSGVAGVGRADYPNVIRSGKLHYRTEKYDPKPGDTIYFDWSCRSVEHPHVDYIQHIEIVTDYKNGYIYTVGGNKSGNTIKDTECGMVSRGTYQRNDSRIVAFGEIDYSGKSSAVTERYTGTYPYGNKKGGTANSWTGGSSNVVSSSSNPDDHPQPTTMVRRNSRGEGVAWVQAICNRLIGTNLAVDGVCGAATVNAIKTFQRKYGLTADGIVGPSTRSKMIEAWNATRVINASSISVSASDINLTIGYNEQLSASVEPANTTDKSVRWTSSNNDIATVNNGVITGRKEGEVTISASTVNGKTASCKVHVYKEKTIKFLDFDGSIISEQKVKYAGSAKAPENPQRTGYTFKGWDGTYQNVKKDAEVQAIYTKNVYKVTFKETNGTKIGDTQKVEYQEAATAPDKSKLTIPDGYKFEGWSEPFDSITSDMTIYPVYKWADEELPLVISADENSCIANTEEGTYTLKFTISNHSETKKKARVMTYMVTNSGKMVAQGETRTVKVPAAKNGVDGSVDIKDMYVVCENAADKVRVVVLDDYESAVPLAEIKDIKVQASGYSEWSDDKASNDKSGQTRTLYRYKKVNYQTSTSKTLDGWTKYDEKSSTTYYGKGDSVWFGNGRNSSAPWHDGAKRTWSVGKSWIQYNPDVYTYPQQIININTYGGDSYKSQVRWIQTCLCRLGYNTAIDGAYGYNTRSVIQNFQRNAGLTVDGQVGPNTSAKLAAYVNEQRDKDYDYYYESLGSTVNYTYYYYQVDSNWSEWQENEVAGDEQIKAGSTKTLVEKKTQYRYKIELPEAVASGTTLTPNCKLPEDAMGLAGKDAIAIVFKNKVSQISEDNVEYIGDTTIGKDGSLNLSFIPREELSYEGTGDYTVVLGVKGTSNYVKVGTIEAPKPVYNVTFIDGNGKAIPIDKTGKTTVQKITEGENAVVPDAPEKKGYRFIGWNLGATNIHADTTITAQYVKDQYTITFVDWENKTIESKEAEYGDYLELPEEPKAVEGLTFKGWMINGDKNNIIMNLAGNDEDISVVASTKGVQINANMLCEAVYETPTFSVKFVDAEGEVVQEQEVKYGESAMAPDAAPSKDDPDIEEGTPTMDDYSEDNKAVPKHVDNMTFVSWGEDIDLTSITSNLVIGAIYEYNESVSEPFASVKTGEYSSDQTVELKTDTEDAIIYYTTDGSNPKDVENSNSVKIYNSPITISDKTVLSFYACKMGMNDSGTQTEWYSINKTGNVPTHVVQVISVNSFDLTGVESHKAFVKDGGKLDVYDLVTKGTNYETIELGGIYYDDAMTDRWQEGSETITESLTLYANYIGKQFDVTYKDEDGSVITKGKVTYACPADATLAPEKSGYKFAGWITEDGKSADCITSNTTVTAKYVENSAYAVIKFTRKSYSIMEGSGYDISTKAKVTYLESGENASDEEVLWSVSNENVATIDSKGNISALTKGEITLTATVASSGEKAECTIIVTGNPETSICLFSNSTYKLADGYLRGIEIGKNSVAEIKKQIDADKLRFVDCDNVELKDTDYVGTKSRIQLLSDNGGSLDEVIVIQIGDYNGDGVINGKDVSGVIRCLIGKETADDVTLRALDLNGDGNVNNRDAAMLSRYLVGKEDLK